ncbi:hypothetical protein [Alkalihalobacillus hemicellulosilyticus]|uniref:glycoside hydrolase family 78 protein n=1 Tax=Halalkalibacter hemicellulosilyticus TaxID=127886 RepID=UPI001F29A6D6|nr:hypothetical protein [Halalkalibacter hemicellulosilyticus]
MIQVYDVRCEYLKNPVGLDVLEPRISWKLTSEERHVRQMSYQLQIAADDDFSSIIWDSNEVISDKNLHITLTDIQLVSRKRYYVRVRVTDQKSNMSSWSDIAYFEMGLLTANEWQANWIIPPLQLTESLVLNLRKHFMYQRKSLELAYMQQH